MIRLEHGFHFILLDPEPTTNILFCALGLHFVKKEEINLRLNVCKINKIVPEC